MPVSNNPPNCASDAGRAFIIRSPRFGTEHIPSVPDLLQDRSKKQPQPCATPPRVLTEPSPEYSEESRRLRVQGTTELSFVAGVDGRSHDIHIVRRLGHGLDEKAIEALTTWTFDPGTNEGVRVPVLLNVAREFRLYPQT